MRKQDFDRLLERHAGRWGVDGRDRLENVLHADPPVPKTSRAARPVRPRSPSNRSGVRSRVVLVEWARGEMS